ncbi:MAG: hypothetical protein NTZ24_12325 [Deltaproteobacteria bacterium]|nr:hypothetical protein [Deltaproteobacteria bacterium]
MFNPYHFNALAKEVKDEFTFFIDEISALFRDNIDWWVTPIASRDTFGYFFFQEVCYALYAREIIKEDLPTEIVCCSRGLGKVIKSLIPLGIQVKISITELWKTRIDKNECVKSLIMGQRQIKMVGSIVYGLFEAFKKHQAAKKTHNLKLTFNSEGGEWIIDEFVFPYSFNDGNFESRHYVNFTDLIKADWVYLPTFIDIHDFTKTYRLMRQNDPPFIIREDFLRFYDYIWSIGHIFRIVTFKRKSVTFRAIDISSIWNEHLFENIDGRINALLNYRLPKRLKECSIEIQGIIDWFENQIVDKAQNMGFRRAYPSVPIFGYEVPYFSEYGMHLQPTKMEDAAGIIPDVVGVIGKEAEEYVKYYNKGLKTCVVPALGYQHLWDVLDDDADKREYVVFALPLVTNKAFEILNIAQETIKISDKEIMCLIKFHPSSDREEIFEYLDSKNIKERFYYHEGDLSSALRNACVFVSSSSSVVLESLSKGIPVIIVGSLTELTHNPAISSVPDDMLKICYTAEDLLKNILFYKTVSEERRARFVYHGQKLHEKYFEKTDKISINRFRECLMSLANP